MRTGGSDGAVTVNYATSDGTALAGSDYLATSGMLFFASGETSKIVAVTIINDSTFEWDAESFTLSLSNPTGGAALGTPATTSVRIVDPWGPVVQFSSATNSISETGGVAVITVTRLGVSEGGFSVSFTTSNGSAQAGSDYVATNGVLTFGDFEASKVISVPILNDSLAEPRERLYLRLFNPTGSGYPAILGEPNVATLIIEDDDGPPLDPGILQFTTSEITVSETAGVARVEVARVGGHDGIVAVSYATSNGTAQAGSDYTPINGLLSFADGETNRTLEIPIINDSDYEEAEMFSLSLQDPVGGAELGIPASVTVRILNDDFQQGILQFTTSEITVSETGVVARVEVARVRGHDGIVAVSYATSNGTAQAGSDYTPINGVLSFADGETNKVLQIPIINDSAYEEAKTFSLSLQDPVGGAELGSPTSVTVRILNDDAPPDPGVLQLTTSAITVSETGVVARVEVARVRGHDGIVAVSYATSNGTAQAGSDYTPISGVLSFADGETNRTLEVPIINDSDYEEAETFSLSLQDPAGGVELGSPASVTVRILNDDAPPDPGLLQFTTSEITVSETAGVARVEVARVRGHDGIVAVSYATSNGTAQAGSDYTPISGVLSFADGETNRILQIPIIDDSDYEEAKTFSLSLQDPVGGAELGSPASVTVRIINDDGPDAICSFAELTEAVRIGGSFRFGCDGTIEITQTLTIAQDTVLDASGRAVTLNGGNRPGVRIFHVNPGVNFTLKNVTVTGGCSTNGAGLYNDGGTVTLLNCTFATNVTVGISGYRGDDGAPGATYQDRGGNGMDGGAGTDAKGGAIFNAGILMATNLTLVGNSARGGTGGPAGAGGQGGQLIDDRHRCLAGSPGGNGGTGGVGGKGFGGGLYNVGQAVLCRATLSGNGATGGSGGDGGRQGTGGCGIFGSIAGSGGPGGTGHGGAIYNLGMLTIPSSTLYGNDVRGGSGGIGGHAASSSPVAGIGGLGGWGSGGAVENAGTILMVNVTLTSNGAAGGDGGYGGLAPYPSSSCFRGRNGNGGDASGGAIYNDNAGYCSAQSCTIWNNHIGGGSGTNTVTNCPVASWNWGTNGTGLACSIHSATSSLTILQSTLVGNLNSTSNCVGAIRDDGYNLASDQSCQFSNTGSRNNTDPKLGPLADFGGPTLTMPLLAGSPALNAVDCVASPATDQRGIVRPFGAFCDIGAFESAPPYTILGGIAGYRAAPGGITVSAGAFSSPVDANGRYCLRGLPGGSYTVKPGAADAVFRLNSRVVTLGPDVVDLNFHSYRSNAVTMELFPAGVTLVLAAAPGDTWRVLTSTNCLDWKPYLTNTISPNGLFEFPMPLHERARFYRAIKP